MPVGVCLVQCTSCFIPDLSNVGVIIFNRDQNEWYRIAIGARMCLALIFNRLRFVLFVLEF